MIRGITLLPGRTKATRRRGGFDLGRILGERAIAATARQASIVGPVTRHHYSSRKGGQ